MAFANMAISAVSSTLETALSLNTCKYKLLSCQVHFSWLVLIFKNPSVVVCAGQMETAQPQTERKIRLCGRFYPDHPVLF